VRIAHLAASGAPRSRRLTEIGNTFMIRHTEVGKTPVEDPDQIDYLFHRIFSSIRLLLKATGRGG